MIRARLDTAAPRVLTCVGSDSMVVDVTWAAGETVAHAVFRGVTDPMTTECALAAIGELTLSAPAPADGRLMHALAR